MVSRLPSGCSCWQLPRPEVLRSQLVAAQFDLAHQNTAVVPWRGRRRRLHGSHEVSAMDGRRRRRGRRRPDSDDSGSSSGREGSPQRPPAQGGGAGAWEDLATDDEWEKVTRQRCHKRGPESWAHVRPASTFKREIGHRTTPHISLCCSGSARGQKTQWATTGRTHRSSPDRLGGGRAGRSTLFAGHVMLTCGQ